MNLTSASRSVIYTHNEKMSSLSASHLPPPSKMAMISPTMPLLAAANDENNISISNRRIITFSSPKSEFDLLKHEQYYSDPNLNFNKKSKFFMEPNKISGLSSISPVNNVIIKSQLKTNIDESAKPMDLTKRKDSSSDSMKMHTPKVSDVVSPIHGANLLSSLVLITDKIPVTTNEITNYSEQVLGDDNNVSYQEYLTERALQDNKMKQSQMNRSQQKFLNMVRTQQKHGGGPVGGSLLMINEKLHGSSNFDVIPKNPQMDVVPNVIISFKHLQQQQQQQQQSDIKECKIDNIKNIILETTSKFEPESDSKLQKPMLLNEVIRSIPGNEAITITTSNTTATISLNEENEISGMETLAEIAAHSVKLDTSNHQMPIIPASTSNNNIIINTNSSSSSNNNNTDNAKSVASEYLKLTKTKANLSNNNNNNTNNNSVIKSDESNNSDQEAGAVIPTATATTSITTPLTTSTPLNVLMDKQLKKSAQPDNKLNKVVARTVVVGEDCFKNPNPNTTNATNDFNSYTRVIQEDGGRPICIVCNKKFQKISHLRIHMNIHYMERKFRCDACAVSFRTQGHLLKHERSLSHHNKVSMTTTFGVATVTNPRPFKCKDCKIAFRIHGHLAKHLRSKMHVLKLECLQKLPFGTYAEIERAGINLTDIDTTDCDNSLVSLRILAQKLHEKDPTKLSAVNLDLPARNRDGNDSADSDVDGDDNGEDDECFTNNLNTNNTNTSTINISNTNNVNLNSLNNSNINNMNNTNINVNDNINENSDNSTNTNISTNELITNPSLTTSPPTTSVASSSTLISTVATAAVSLPSVPLEKSTENSSSGGAGGSVTAANTTNSPGNSVNTVTTALKRKLDENTSASANPQQQQQQEKKLKVSNSNSNSKISNNSNDS